MMDRMLTTAMEYRPALLWLLGQVGEARTADVLAEFDRRLGHLIPPQHRERIKSGYTRWENFVHWARLLLVQAGFMTSGERGIWGITPAGKAWLQRYPDGGDWRDLTALTRKTATRSWGRAAGAEPKAATPTPPAAPQALRSPKDYRPALLWLMGQLGVSRASAAIKAFERSLGHIIPPEHRRSTRSGRSRWEEYVHWARQDLVKAGFMGAEKRGLWTITAEGRAWLEAHPDGGGRQLSERLRWDRRAGRGAAEPASPAQAAELRAAWAGDVEPAEAGTVLQPSGPEAGAAPPRGSMDYAAFFGAVQERLQGRLPEGLQGQAFGWHRNLVRIGCPISRSYYALRLARAYTEIALHLEGRQEQNLAVLGRLQADTDLLQAQLGEPILVERWGRDRARMYVVRPPGRMDAATAVRLADDWSWFIAATLPTLEAIALDLRIPVRKRHPSAGAKEEDLTRQRAILAGEVRAIRGFLAGDAGGGPGDEQLCDWVQFCYVFELFAEAAALFRMIRPAEVDPWLYARAERSARACEARLNPPG